MIFIVYIQSDWDLHAAFFESIVSVARLLGHRSLPILQPLVQQVSIHTHTHTHTLAPY